MRLFWKAIRALTVETIGVGAVVWVVFAAAGWTMQAVDDRPSEAGNTWQWLEGKTRDFSRPWQPRVESRERERYVEQRLDHYSRLYQERAREYFLPAT